MRTEKEETQFSRRESRSQTHFLPTFFFQSRGKKEQACKQVYSNLIASCSSHKSGNKPILRRTGEHENRRKNGVGTEKYHLPAELLFVAELVEALLAGVHRHRVVPLPAGHGERTTEAAGAEEWRRGSISCGLRRGSAAAVAPLALFVCWRSLRYVLRAARDLEFICMMSILFSWVWFFSACTARVPGVD